MNDRIPKRAREDGASGPPRIEIHTCQVNITLGAKGYGHVDNRSAAPTASRSPIHRLLDWLRRMLDDSP